MTCPYCNQEMQKGFLAQTDVFWPIRWRPVPKEPPMLFYSNKESIKLTSSLNSGQVIVYHCPDCRKFVIDQDELAV